MNPIEMVFLSLWNLSNCLNSLIKDNFPNGLLIEALNAMVGAVAEKCLIHAFVTLVGTKSTLFRTNTKCLYGQLFFKCASTCLHLVPSGSLASMTIHTTSLLSSTL